LRTMNRETIRRKMTIAKPEIGSMMLGLGKGRYATRRVCWLRAFFHGCN